MSGLADDLDNGSFWFDSLELESTPPDTLPEQADVAIIGGGFTGLWTAYYLKTLQPDIDIAVFEAATPGFGASGRNGGWCMGLAEGIHDRLADPDEREAGQRMLRAMHDTVDEVGRVCQAENIDCHYAKGGTLTVATKEFRVDALRRSVATMHGFGYTDDDYRWLDGEEARSRINCEPNFGAMYTPHCAAIHPARLVRGLADVVRAKGVRVLEQTPVTEFAPGRVTTERGTVRAEIIVRATEGYTDSITGERRKMMPLYSMMVATEPLSEAAWQDIGLRQRETFGDGRRVVIYGQRTLDDRFAFGGRAGYYFGSKRLPRIAPEDANLDHVEAILRELFPQIGTAKVTHRWGGLMGVPRSWRPQVTFDRATGIAVGGGYIGEGVAASNLAGRTMADLILERDTETAQLPWVADAEPRKWEMEPARWLGAKTLSVAAVRADRKEERTNKPSSFWGGLFDKVMG